MGDETDAAGIVFVARIIETLRHRQTGEGRTSRSDGFHGLAFGAMVSLRHQSVSLSAAGTGKGFQNRARKAPHVSTHRK
jgi:hypothetical protein